MKSRVLHPLGGGRTCVPVAVALALVVVAMCSVSAAGPSTHVLQTMSLASSVDGRTDVGTDMGALFDAAAPLTPGSSKVRCAALSAVGRGKVTFSATNVTGSLSEWLDVDLAVGSGSDLDCSDFVGEAVWSGTLQQLEATAASGGIDVNWQPEHQNRLTFRLRVSVADNEHAAGRSTNADFVWEQDDSADAPVPVATESPATTNPVPGPAGRASPVASTTPGRTLPSLPAGPSPEPSATTPPPTAAASASTGPTANPSPAPSDPAGSPSPRQSPGAGTAGPALRPVSTPRSTPAPRRSKAPALRHGVPAITPSTTAAAVRSPSIHNMRRHPSVVRATLRRVHRTLRDLAAQIDKALPDVARTARGVAEKAHFPLALLLIAAIFLSVQNRLDARDPKLALAPLYAEPDAALPTAGSRPLVYERPRGSEGATTVSTPTSRALKENRR